ncbi:MAG: hypothetical protein CL431_02160 [Acidimicrobiaceae bacterium]|jgi:hypothetical protein|nr:hypothetical protein [Acidimicrobiaceae bacterium]|tara:strand:+ start:36777 stop:37238 length:462 start_codon:yes stop_codon:yes gene_type:complete
MFNRDIKRFRLILLGLTIFAALIGCSDSSSNVSQENDRIVVGEVDESASRCMALSTECGYGYDYQNNVSVDLWELSADGSYWLLKEEFEDVGARCEALTESCGWRWFPNTETYLDVWIFDYGSMEFIENPDLPYIPKGLEPGDPPVKQPGRGG